MAVEKALALDAEDARPHVVLGSPRAEELAHDGVHTSVGRVDLLLHDDVEGGRGLGHLTRHQLAEPSGMALIEETEEEGLDVPTQPLLGRRIGRDVGRVAIRRALLGVLDDGPV